MKLYLVRHGEAVSRNVHPERPLSERGRAEVRSVAARFAQGGVAASVLLHSGKKRAQETAELLGAAIALRSPMQRVAGIDPSDATEAFAREVEQWTEDAVVVGHLPFMSRLVSRLLARDEGASPVHFHTGTAVCLEREGSGSWKLAWVIHPSSPTPERG